MSVSSDVTKVLVGVAIGAAAVAVLKSPSGRKACAKLFSAGLQLKEEASEFVESLKEDAEDIKAEVAAAKKASN